MSAQDKYSLQERGRFKAWWDAARPLEGSAFPYEIAWAAWQAALSAQPSPGGQDALPPMPACRDRQPDDMPGYMESALDWVRDVDNCDAVDWLIDNHAAIRAALAARQPVVAVPQGCDACERTGIRQNDEGRNVFCPDCDLGRASAGDTSHPVGRSFQAGVAEWMGQCFLPSLYSNMTERGDRLLEEVLELLQAHGYDKARVPSLVDYVFGRPVGEPAQEVGGVMVTLAGYCWVAGLDMHAAGDAELARISQPEVMAKIRAKQEAKNALHFDTPLPGNAARQPVAQEPAFFANRWEMEHGTADGLVAMRAGKHMKNEDFFTVPLYAAPPAQAVDLGRIRATVQALLNWIDDWAETPEESGIDALEIEAAAVLDLIDSQTEVSRG